MPRPRETFVSPNEPSSAVLTATQESLAALQPTVGHDRRYLIRISLDASEFASVCIFVFITLMLRKSMSLRRSSLRSPLRL
jgi:hypothetical protein